jgi:hypothetical protein
MLGFTEISHTWSMDSKEIRNYVNKGVFTQFDTLATRHITLFLILPCCHTDSSKHSLSNGEQWNYTQRITKPPLYD